MDYIPGSLKFFEKFFVAGSKLKKVNTTPGHIYITLVADVGIDTDVLHSQYINAITPLLPIGQTITVSIEESIPR